MSSDANLGNNFIPASQRPDGTWRKPRRVKEGYVPQEEVPLYESKGKQFLNRQTQVPRVPVDPNCGKIPHSTIPGLFIEVKPKNNKKKQKKASNIEKVSKDVAKMKIIEPPAPQQDPAKRLRNLRKRLREIESLEQKINSGEIKNPEKDQLEKVTRKQEIEKEIKTIEDSMEK